ncbi:MAG: amidohydrolase family protein [Gammaproteobacteria bacterium]
MEKIWANSGDSHFVEPTDLWTKNLPPHLAERMPRQVIEGEFELVYVDGEVMKRVAPTPARKKVMELSAAAPGARDVKERMKDLDQEGIWGEVVYPSLGMWQLLIKDPKLIREANMVLNDWALSEIQGYSPRLVCTACVSMRSIEDAVAETHRAAGKGFRAIFLPTRPPDGQQPYHREYWEPLWAAAEEAGMVLAFHIGTDSANQVMYQGPGGAVLNYVETTYGGQRVTTQLVASGALDRHPKLKVLISEGGATWAPFLGDRMNEAYRQHPMFVKPKLSMLPKEYIYRQVYASFQHDESAIPAVTAMGYRNVMWGSDYPHLEGTYGHTQETLQGLFDGVTPEVRDRVLFGAFEELFPNVGRPPAAKAA